MSVDFAGRGDCMGEEGENQHQRASARSWSSMPFVKAFLRAEDSQMQPSVERKHETGATFFFFLHTIQSVISERSSMTCIELEAISVTHRETFILTGQVKSLLMQTVILPPINIRKTRQTACHSLLFSVVLCSYSQRFIYELFISLN